MKKQIKAIALISGGLDSLLAAKLIKDQGIHVEGLNFNIGFGEISGTRKKKQPKVHTAKWVSDLIGIKLHTVDIIEEFRPILLHPKHDYGSNMNPCLDCKIFMVKKAMQWIKDNDFDFIVTGEVLGQRPKSQRKETMPITARESGANDLLVRPLCAKNLPATKPELKGWIDRDKLYDISGRSRKPQMELATHFGFNDYPSPAGGCLLTDQQYSVKLRDLIAHRKNGLYSKDDIMLLKVGRHLRINDNYKLIIGREEAENDFIENYKDKFILAHTPDHPGPVVLIDGTPSNKDFDTIAAIVGRFGKGRNESTVCVKFDLYNKDSREISIKPLTADKIEDGWYI